MSELAPLVNAQYGVFYVTKREEDETDARAGRQLRRRNRERAEAASSSCAKAWSARRPPTSAPILLKNVPADFIRIGSGLGHATPANVIILPALFEDEVKAVIELASFSEFNETHQSFLDQLMESVGIVLNTIAATMRTEGLLEAVAAADPGAAGAPDRAHHQAGGAARDQRGAAGEGAAAREREEAGRGQEPRDRHGAPRGRGEGRAARAHLQVQVRIPGQHEPRAAHAAQLAADPVEAAGRQPAGQSQREADRVRAHDQLGGLGPAEPDQRHSRSVEDRIRHGRRSRSARCRWRASGSIWSAPSASSPPTRASTSTSSSTPRCPPTIRTDEKRLQQVVLNLLSNAFKFTAQGSVTLRSAWPTAGWSTNHPVLRSADQAIEIAVTDTGIGIPEGQAEADLRGLPAGRRHHQPQIWRHRPWPVDQPRDRPPARRRVAGALEPRRRLDLHPVRAAAGGGAGDRAAGRQPRPATTIAARWCPRRCRAPFELSDDRDASTAIRSS